MTGFYVMITQRRTARSKAQLVRAFDALTKAGFSGARAAEILLVPHCNVVRWRRKAAR